MEDESVMGWQVGSTAKTPALMHDSMCPVPGPTVQGESWLPQIALRLHSCINK